MAVVAEKPQNAEITTRPQRWSPYVVRVVATIAGMLVLVVLAHLVLVADLVSRMFVREHYQYILLLPIAVAALLWTRLPAVNELRPAPLLRWAPILVTGLVLLAVAILYWSPWLAMPAMLLTLLGVATQLGGTQLRRAIGPSCVILLFAIPLPMNLDLGVVRRLRNITTNWASAVLDELGVLHLMRGNVIELPEESLFVEDACSGINSLFVLVCCATFLGLWLKRRPIHVMLLAGLAVGIVLVENVVRVVAIALAAKLGVAMTEEPGHTILGVVLFILSLLLLFATDQLLLLTIPRRRASAAVANAFNDSKSLSSERVTGPSRVHVGCLAALLLIAGGIQLVAAPATAKPSVSLTQEEIEFPKFGLEALPENIAGWTRRRYDTEERDPSNAFGEHSQTWTYERAGNMAIVSLDSSYPEPHELTWCYGSIGWSIDTRLPAVSGRPDITAPFIRATMSKPLGGFAYVLFSSCNEEGAAGLPLDGIVPWRDRVNGLLSRKPMITGDRSNAVPEGPWFQVQVLWKGTSPASADDQQELDALFFESRELLHELALTHLSSGTPVADHSTLGEN